MQRFLSVVFLFVCTATSAIVTNKDAELDPGNGASQLRFTWRH